MRVLLMTFAGSLRRMAGTLRRGDWRQRQVGLQVKIGAFVLAVLLVVFGLVGYLALQALSESTDRTLDERLVLAETIARGMDQTLSQRLQQLQTFAAEETIDLEDNDLVPEKQALDELHRYSGPFVASTFLLNKDGDILWTVPETADWAVPLGALPNVAETFRTGEPQVSGKVRSPIDGSPMVSFSVAIKNEAGETVGLAGSNFGPASAFIQSLVQPVELGETTYLEVVSEEGIVLTTTKPGTQADPFAETDHADRFTALIAEGRSVVRTCHRCHDPQGTGEKREDVMAFAPLTTAPWGVAIRQAEDEAFALTRDLERNFFVFGGVALAVALVAAWIGARTITKPVRDLTVASERIAAGHLDEEVRVGSRDEIGQLAGAFESMRQRLQTSRQEIDERTRDLERRNRELASMTDIARVLSQSLDIDAILGQALGRLLALVEAHAGAIFLKEGSAGMKLEVAQGLSPEMLGEAGERVPLNVISAEESEAREGEGESAQVGKGGLIKEVQSSCRVPLVSKGQVVGSVLAIRRGPRSFSRQDMDLMVAITRQIGMAIGNAELFRETTKRKQEIEALYEIGVKMSALLDIDKILETVVASGRQLLDAEVAVLTLLDASAQEVCVRAVSGTASEDLEDIRLSRGRGISGKIMTLDQPVATSDYLKDTSFGHSPQADALVRRKGLRSVLGVPLSIGGEALGALIVARKEEAEFSPTDIDILSRLANQAAIAVENARLYQGAQEMAAFEERERIAREMHDSLAQVLGYLRIQTSALEDKLAAGELAPIAEGLQEMRKAARDAYEDVRQGILALRTASSLKKGLIPSLEEFLQEYRTQSGLDVEVQVVDEAATRLSARAEGQLLRIIQEALTNVRKHAHARRVRIRFELWDSMVQTTVEDSGRGFKPAEARRGRHFGLDTMRERAESVGGKLLVESKPGAGTRVVVRLPLEE